MNVGNTRCPTAGILLSSLLIFAGDATGQRRSSSPTIQEQFIGSWKLVSYEVGASYPMGCDAVGLLMYGADGRMSLQIMRPDRPKFRSAGSKEGGYEGGTAEETQAAFRGNIAYFGAYEVNVKRRFVTHRIEGSLFPNWVGRDQIEFFEISDDRMTWGLDPIRYTWKRISRVTRARDVTIRRQD